MRRMLTVVYLIFLPMAVSAQKDVQLDPVLEFLGITTPEDADSHDVQCLLDLLEKPLRINQVSQHCISSSSLFTSYQAASLKDYTERHGDVLSFAELSSVDGFGKDFVSRLAPVVSLETSALPGERAGGAERISKELMLRSAARTGNQMNYGGKYRLSFDDSAILTLSLSSSYDSWPQPSAVSGSLALKAGKANIILGDFNARFGQGLILWNGMSVGGLSSPITLSRRPTGLSQPWSFTGTSSFTGAAVEIQTSNVVCTLMLDASETLKSKKDGSPISAAADISWYRNNAQLSLTSTACVRAQDVSGGKALEEAAVAMSQRWTLSGVTIFSDLALDFVSRTPALICGVSMKAAEKFTSAAMFRYYHQYYSVSSSSAPRSGTSTSNEYGMTIAGEYKSRDKLLGVFSIDAACFPEPKSRDEERSYQVKASSDWNWNVNPEFEMKVRVAERIRSWGHKSKTEARLDFLYNRGIFANALRLHAVRCDDVGLLGYVETGITKGEINCYIRFGLFCIDDWDDRIYAYERDAPGTFNVPAYYGRGLWTALTGSWRFARWGRLYLRVSYIDYPFMMLEKQKPGRAELRFQIQFDL